MKIKPRLYINIPYKHRVYSQCVLTMYLQALTHARTYLRRRRAYITYVEPGAHFPCFSVMQNLKMAPIRTSGCVLAPLKVWFICLTDCCAKRYL